MGLNPRKYNREQFQDEMLYEMFQPNQSPYFAMFRAGKMGIPIEKVVTRLSQVGIPIRKKDVVNWQNGVFAYQMQTNPTFKAQVRTVGVPANKTKLSDYPMFPQSWVSTKIRYFPCTADNKPMQKWGWSRDYSPQLYELKVARALSPCGWVGQNMLYQRFVVVDIDGRGHGEDDQQVINFGNRYKHATLCMEDPTKLGSFHLYFATDRILPVRHYPWAKLDFMGNAVNAAVYLKNKKSNKLPMKQLTEEIWQDVQSYQQDRKKELQ